MSNISTLAQIFLKLISFTLVLLIACVNVQGQTWTKLIPSTATAPSARQNSSGIYNPAGNSLVIYGGRNDGGNLSDIWSFNLDSLVWTNVTPSDTLQPAARFAHTAIYDPINHTMVIWSGQGSGFYDDLWAFDLNGHTWQKRSATGTIPAARYGSAAMYNPIDHRLTIFAGFTVSGRFDDTRAYDIALNSWVDLTPSGTKPLLRCLHTACYDEGRHRMIIYGGQNSGPLDDIWAFDLTANTWADLTPPVRPLGRIFPSSVYANNHVIVFGGLTVNGSVDEIWAYNLVDSTWTPLAPSGSVPEKRNSHAAVYVPADESMIVFGGQGDSLLNDVWKLSNIVTGIHEATPLPATFELYQNYPNPFNPVTRIQYTVAGRQHVNLTVYNMLGEAVTTLVDAVVDGGHKYAEWNAGAAPSGVYVVKLKAGKLTQARKMVLLR